MHFDDNDAFLGGEVVDDAMDLGAGELDALPFLDEILPLTIVHDAREIERAHDAAQIATEGELERERLRDEGASAAEQVRDVVLREVEVLLRHAVRPQPLLQRLFHLSISSRHHRAVGPAFFVPGWLKP